MASDDDNEVPVVESAKHRGSQEFSPQVYIKDENGEFVPVALEPIDEDDNESGAFILAAQQKYHSGPLPSVEMFKAYGDVVPDAPERILKMAEDEQKAAHEFSRTALSHEKTLVTQGQWMGFISMTIALVGGIGLAVYGQPYVAAALVSPAVLTPIMRFYFKGKHEAKPPDRSEP